MKKKKKKRDYYSVRKKWGRGEGGKGSKCIGMCGATVKEQRKSDWLAPRRLGVIWGKYGPL